MPFRALDPRFPSLTLHCLSFYWLVCLVTLGITIGSVVRQVGVYQADCSTYSFESNSTYYGEIPSNITYYEDISYETECIPGDIVVLYVLVLPHVGPYSLTQLQRSRTRRSCYWNDTVLAPVIPLLSAPYFSFPSLHFQRCCHDPLDSGNCNRMEPDKLVLRSFHWSYDS